MKTKYDTEEPSTREQFEKHLGTLSVRHASFLREYEQWLSHSFATDESYASVQLGITSYALATRMFNGLVKGTSNKDSRAVLMACRKFGIKHTYKAIKEYLA